MKVDYNLAVVRKSNSLVEASYKLSVNEQRLILMLTASVKKDDQDFASYIISVKDFAKCLGLSKNNSHYQRIADLITGLQKKVLTVTDTVVINNKTKERIQKINWLSYSAYIQGEGKIELCFHPKLKPYLLNLKERFTSYKFKEIAQLKSRFSVRIYELLKQYEGLKKRTFKLDDLRRILKIEPDQYNPYFNFKNRVILIAQRELNDNASITFDFEEIKVCRKVEKLTFYIKKKIVDGQNIADIHDIITVEDNISREVELTELLPSEYRDKASIKKLIKSYLDKHGYDYVARNIAYTNDKSNAVNPGKNLNKRSNYRNYLKKALEKDFGLAFVEDLEEKNKEEQLQREAEELKRKEEARKKSAEEAKAKVDELIQGYIKTLSKDEREILEQEAISRLEGEKKESVLNKKAGSNILLKVEIKQVVKERLLKE